jgi:hypothetical protein
MIILPQIGTLLWNNPTYNEYKNETDLYFYIKLNEKLKDELFIFIESNRLNATNGTIDFTRIDQENDIVSALCLAGYPLNLLKALNNTSRDLAVRINVAANIYRHSEIDQADKLSLTIKGYTGHLHHQTLDHIASKISLYYKQFQDQ